VKAASARWGRIDGLVNNAGALAAGAFAEHEDGAWQDDIALKLMGAVRLTRLALPALRESERRGREHAGHLRQGAGRFHDSHATISAERASMSHKRQCEHIPRQETTPLLRAFW
jgi:NAD(P)-dependent dehydrogenase (short-subunit alcohol dehydrogenase family)